MTSIQPDPPAPDDAVAGGVLEYQAPPAPQRRMWAVAWEFAAGAAGSYLCLCVLIWFFTEGMFTPSPSLALMLLFATLVIAAIGTLAFVCSVAVRMRVLRGRGRLPSRRAAIATGVGYVLQMIALAFAVSVVGTPGPYIGLLALVPLVPLLAPNWLVRERAA